MGTDFTKSAERPITNRMLAILDPITLPTTISEVPLLTAVIEVASSGSEVPKATIVTPIINGAIPKDNPISSADLTNQSDALSNTPRLTMKRIIYISNESIPEDYFKGVNLV